MLEDINMNIFNQQLSFEFVAGACTVLAGFLVPKFFSLLWYPSVEEIQAEARQPVLPRGDNARLTIWGFNKRGEYNSHAQGIPDSSSFTGRIECFLRLHGKLDYVKEATNNLTESPRGLVPVANIFGKMVDDSPRIRQAIKEHYGITDPQLTDQQIAMARLVECLTTTSLSKVLLHMMFHTKEGRDGLWEKNIKAGVPLPLRPFIKAMIFRNQATKLRYQGLSTLPEEEIYENATRDLRALETILGKQTYILGTEEATEADIDVYIYVGHIFYNKLYNQQRWSVQMKSEFPTLLAYTDRMRKLLFPELDN